MRGWKCVREGKPVDGEEEGAEEERKRKREGRIFILQHHSYLSCRLACACFARTLMAEMKSSLMARQRTDRPE